MTPSPWPRLLAAAEAAGRHALADRLYPLARGRELTRPLTAREWSACLTLATQMRDDLLAVEMADGLARSMSESVRFQADRTITLLPRVET